MTAQHQTVLLEEAVHALVSRANGTYVDCTYGRGGHSAAILEQLDADGRLLAIDRDPEAIAHANKSFANEPRAEIVHGPFSQLKQFVRDHELGELDGVLMDLGVSSPQLDNADRGFSFQRSGPLDMRMDTAAGPTAQAWLESASEEEITIVLKRYGEERFARRIARKILETRLEGPLDTTEKLVQIVETSVPKKEKHKHPATRTFQAVRIQVNQELQELESALRDVVELLRSGGRIVVISFHSLEDRIVKQFFRRMAQGEPLPDKLPIRDADIERKLRLIGKAKRAGEHEIERNRRARSSIMRVAEKL